MSLLTTKSVPKRILAGAAGLLLTAGFAGCSNDDAEDLDLEETMDASEIEPTEYIPASEEGPAQNVPVPRLPAVATENSDEGAEATFEYFWEAEEYARLTGETELIAVASKDGCVFCSESIEGWAQSYDDGYWTVLHGELRVEIVDVETKTDDEHNRPVAYIFFQLDEPATDFYDSEGVETDESFEAPDVNDWFARLFYDATAQRWEVEWLGLEESVTWEG